MAFVTRDSMMLSDMSEDAVIPPSFMTTNDEDPFSAGGGNSEVYPDARRNILEDINNAEHTVLPPPPSKECIAVFLRVKPRTEMERELVKDSKEQMKNDLVEIESDFQVALNAPKDSNAYKNCGATKLTHRYTFTRIFKPETNQSEIFQHIVCPKVKDFLEGQNQLIFTYGATSSGKTYTIQGVLGNSGIMPRAIDTVFSSIGNKCEKMNLRPTGYNGIAEASETEMDQLNKEKNDIFKLGKDLLGVRGRISPDISTMSGVSTASSVANSVTSSCSTVDGFNMSHLYAWFPGLQGRDREETKLEVKDRNISYSVWVSFAEIYNENIHDLLKKVPESKKKGEKVKRPTLKLSDDRSGQVYINGLREVQVSSADEAYQILMIGRENLHFAATRLNQHSSRSHCIFTVKLVRVADPTSPHLARVSMLSFCDLAGSERISKTKNVGERQKEAGNINTSLLVLGRCIKAIRHNQSLKEKKGLQIVPFRESKLTRLFKSSFTGLGKSSLIICISQAQYLFDESIQVCKFASIASKVTVETKKEPPPKKVAKKSSRFSSMIDKGRNRLLSFGGNSILSGRGSIAWEAPPRVSILGKSVALPASFNPNARSTIVGGVPPRLSTLINISEMEEVGEGDETVPCIDNTVVQTQYESLMGLVENLKQKLIDERKKNQNLEKEIREELCEEFNSMLVEVESGWERRLQAEKEDAVRMNDWRIGELQTVHRNRNKRRRENDSGEFQNEIDAHRLRSQLESKEKEVTDLCAEMEDNRQQMEVMKETTVKSKQEQDRLQMANSKLKFELAEQQRLNADLGKKVEESRAHVDEEKKNSTGSSEENELILAERRLGSLREELMTREEEVSDLKDLIQEAGDEFLAKEEELKDLQKVVLDMEDKTTQQGVVIQDLQAQLEESHELLQAVNTQLEESEQRVDDLEQELEKMEKEDVKDIKETIVKLRKQVGELEGELRIVKEQRTAAEELSTDLKNNLEAAEKVAEEERDNAKDAEERMIEAQSERNKLISEKSKLLEQLAEIKENKGSQSQELEVSIECFDLKQQLESLKTANKELVDSNDIIKKHSSDLKAEVESLRILNNEMKNATNVDESMMDVDEIEHLKEKIDTLAREKESFEEELKSHKETIEKLKGEHQKFKEDLELKETVKIDELVGKHEKEVATLNDEIDSQKKDLSNTKEQLKATEEKVNEVTLKVKDLEEQLEASEKLMEEMVEDDEKEVIKSKLEQTCSELAHLQKEVQDSKHSESNLLNSIKELKASHQKITEERDKTVVENKRLLSDMVSKDNLKEVDDVSRKVTSLEKDLSLKTNYIKELEDIIVDKEFKISEMEKSEGNSSSVNESDKLKEMEESKIELQRKLKVSQDHEKKLEVRLEELTAKAAENFEVMAHQEKMKRQRDDLEKRVLELEKASQQLSQVEDELKDMKDAKRNYEENLFKAEEGREKLKTELDEAKDELKVLKRAAKTGAKDAQEVLELKSKNDELSKEVERLNSVVFVSSREQGALDVLKSELEHKSKEIAQVQEKVEDLLSTLGSKNKEISLLTEKVEYLQSNIDSKEYDLVKTKDDRDKLMEHYDKVLKKKQEELDSLKALDREKSSLGEIMAKATPSKQTGELKRKLAQSEAEIGELKDKLLKEEDKSGELRTELINLQKQMDTKIAQHEREVNRTKLANQKVIAEYRDTNKELQRKIEVSVTSPASPNDDTSPTLEADDSKTDASLIEGTPVTKKGKGRGRGKGRTNRSTASLASCEESNNENDPDVGRPRTASVSRKSRVTRKSNKDDNETKETDRSMSRKRTVSSRSEGNILREKQSFALSPVPEGERSANSSTDFSIANTPALKKKRKLCSMTPQHSEVFTPPTDLEQSTPGSVVKRQLRTRRQSKR